MDIVDDDDIGDADDLPTFMKQIGSEIEEPDLFS